jgi:hypothetical protein
MFRSFKNLLLTGGVLALASLVGTAPSFAAHNYFTFDHTQFKASCEGAGGSYTSADGGFQGCAKANCDGKGGTCHVECVGDSCSGTTPDRLVGRLSFRAILHDGIKAPPAPDQQPNIFGSPNEQGSELFQKEN